MRYSYIEPPEFVKNHPLLMKRYEKIMKKYTNPTDVRKTLPYTENDDGGRAYLEERLKAIVI